MAEWLHSHHLAVLHPSEPALLVCGGALPHFTPEDSFFAGAQEGVAFLQGLGLEAHMTRPLAKQADETTHCADTLLLFELQSLPAVLPGVWLKLPDLETLQLPETLLEALREVLLEETGAKPIPTERPVWLGRRGFARLAARGAERLRALGYDPQGKTAQLKQWHISSVGRFTTDQGAVYLKALPSIFAREAPVTRVLSELFPGQVPAVLAWDAAAGWFLSADAGAKAPEKVWMQVAQCFAELQLGSRPHLAALRAAGCLVRSLDDLAARLTEIITHDLAQSHLSAEERRQVRAALPRWQADLDTLAGAGLPDTLVHGDFHIGNVALQGSELVMFDWTDACISHPLFDLVNLVAYLDDSAPVAAAYLGPWREAYPALDLAALYDLARCCAPLFYTDTYVMILDVLEPAARWQFATVPAHFLRQAIT